MMFVYLSRMEFFQVSTRKSNLIIAVMQSVYGSILIQKIKKKPNKIYKGESFKRNCGAASVGVTR